MQNFYLCRRGNSCKRRLQHLTSACVESSGSVISNFDSLRPKVRARNSFSPQRPDTNKLLIKSPLSIDLETRTHPFGQNTIEDVKTKICSTTLRNNSIGLKTIKTLFTYAFPSLYVLTGTSLQSAGGLIYN